MNENRAEQNSKVLLFTIVFVSIITSVFVSIITSFGYDLITATHKVFPYEEKRYHKNTVPNGTGAIKYRPKYLHKKSFFEQHGLKANIVMIGDSMTDGAEWHELLKTHDVVNRGIGRDTTQGVLNRMSSIISSNAQKAFIMIGINDFSRGDSVDDVYNNYKEIIKELKANQILPYIQSTILASGKAAKFNLSIAELNKKLKLLALAEGLVYIDLNKGLSPNGTLKDEFTRDGVHLNGKGYSVWGSLIEPYIVP